MSTLRTALSVTVRSERLVAVAAVVALLEAVVRLVLSIAISPLAGTLWPPFIAVIGLASVVPTVREMTAERIDEGTRSTATLRSRLPSLIVVAIGGHVLAVTAGTALFLLVDTPVRYGLYWVGRGDLLSSTVILLSPLVGVTIGTFVAWVVPATAVVRIVDGSTGARGLRAALGAVVTRPRAVGGAAVHQLALVGVLNATIGVGSWIGSGLGPGPQYGFVEHMFFPLAIVLEGNIGVFPIALGGLVGVFGAALWLALALVVIIDGMDPIRGQSPMDASIRTTIPVPGLVLAVLVTTALVATAGAIRMSEIRPMDTSPEPLPDDPDGLYATAWENTIQTSHEYRVVGMVGSDEIASVYRMRIDREDRRITSVTSHNGELTGGERPSYASTGLVTPVPAFFSEDVALGTPDVGDNRTVRAGQMPGYPRWESGGYLRHSELSNDATGWEIVDESDDEVTLELTEPAAVYAALTGGDLETHYGDIEVHESRVRMTIDTESKTLSDGELRLNVTGSGGRGIDKHLRYEYDVGTDVDRPTEFGSPGAGELLWRLFAY